MTLSAPCPRCDIVHVAERGIDNWLIVRCPMCGRQPRPPLTEPVKPPDTLIAWKGRARAEMDLLAASGMEFSADDITAAVGMPFEPNMVGALFVAAHKAGLIRPVGVRSGGGASRHGGSQRTWIGVKR